MMVAGYGMAAGRRGWRVAALIGAVALALAFVLLNQQVAEAQINFGSIFCGILLSIRAAFAGSPFFGFIASAIDAILAAFGCGPS